MEIDKPMTEESLGFLAEHGQFANFIQQCFKDNIPEEKIEFLFNYTMNAYKELEGK